MSLAPGVRLGVYEIVAPLSAGGMGEVYRARDSRLHRDVALKIVRSDRPSTPETRARFQTEAQAVAALSHPNILAIHDIGGDNDQLYMVTELLEGETLRARLERGPLPWRKAVEISAAIADGLAATHAKGIVHRDLKPANIFLTSDGRVKVLDFGVAKLRNAINPDLRDTTMSQSGEGVIGTACYMAPEQAAGKTVDARTDLFALGCVLYEMVSGRRPFEHGTAVETMAAIINEDPAEPGAAPPDLRRLIAHSLEKNPGARFQSAHDFAFSLRLIRDGVPSAAAPVASGIGGRRMALVGAAIAVVAAAFAAVSERAGRVEPVVTPVTQMHLLPPENHQIGFTPSVSPDGRSVAFAARGSDGRSALWIRSLDSLNARRLEDTADAFAPFWSPDSHWLGFFANNKLSKVDVSDGAVQDICDTTLTPMGGVWRDNGTIVFARSVVGPLYQVSASGGRPTPLTRLDSGRGETSHRFPVALPGGRHLLYVAVTENPFTQQLYMTADGTDASPVTDANDIERPFYADGYLLFLRGSNVMAAVFDEPRARFASEPVVVAQDVSVFSVAASTLAYVGDVDHQLVWIDRHGRQIEVLPIRGRFGIPKISHDGRRVAIQKQDAQNRGDIWIYDLARHTGTPVTFGPANDRFPSWSPDDERVVFSSNGRGNDDIYEKASSGIGDAKLVYASELGDNVTSWSNDGRFLLFNTAGERTGTGAAQDLWSFFLDKGEARLLFKTPFREHDAQISPDGRWMAYAADDTGRHAIYVQTFPPSGSRWRISTAGGLRPKWREDGRELVYLATDTLKFMSVAIRTAPSFEAGAPQVLFDAPRLRNQYTFDMTADAQRFLAVTFSQRDGGTPITLVQNWQALLKK